MSQPHAVVVRAPGINCDQETARAWELAGAHVDIVHVNRLFENPDRLDRVDVLTLPGGFSYGDDISAGRILANSLVQQLGDTLRAFIERGRLILGICNGFQILVKAGLLTADQAAHPCTLAFNAGGSFVCRWVSVKCATDRCVFLERDREYFLPIAHAEGRFLVPASASLEADRVALRYVDGVPRIGPTNPNASFQDVAALTDATGRVLGMMPHPERFVDRTQHPFWTAADASLEPDGLSVFRAAVAFLP